MVQNFEHFFHHASSAKIRHDSKSSPLPTPGPAPSTLAPAISSGLSHNGRTLIDEGPLDAVGDENSLEQLPVSHRLVWKLHLDPLSVVATAK